MNKSIACTAVLWIVTVFGGLTACEPKAAGPDVSAANGGSTPPAAGGDALDLRSQVGRGAYTLQLGYYDNEFGNDFRQAAEKAARTLRNDGHKAFYYHGPNVSLVTIGVFGAESVSTNPRTGGTEYGPEVQALQKQFPHHMANGREVIRYMPNGTKTRETSMLVRIPSPRRMR